LKIGFIGTGIMGSPMALHLAHAGHDVTVFNRTISKAEALKSEVKVAYSLKELAFDKDVIFSIVGYPKDVKEVIEEVFLHAKVGATIIDMTTSSPKLAEDLYQKGLGLGYDLLDAPVTGGDIGAKNATLSIMVGGSKEVFDKVLPLFEVLGKTITYTGKAGTGQFTKLANQIAIAGALSGVVESLFFAYNKNLDIEAVHKVLSGGSASSNQLMSNGRRIIQNDYEPGFMLKHFLKDLNLAIDAIDEPLFIATKVRDMIKLMVDQGYENKGTQALILYYLNKNLQNS